MIKHCCEQITAEVEKECKDHSDRSQCPDALVAYFPKFDEYGILIHDGGSSFIQIYYCPWCGTQLPPSMRHRWFEELETRGIDPWSDMVPEEFQSDKWFRKHDD